MPLRPTDVHNNIKYWDEALTAARSHGHIYLEALAVKNLGIEALMQQGYRTLMPARYAYCCSIVMTGAQIQGSHCTSTHALVFALVMQTACTARYTVQAD